MSSGNNPGHFAMQLLQQDQPFSESEYKEYRMKLEDALTAARRRERPVGQAAWVSFLIGVVLMFVGGVESSAISIRGRAMRRSCP